MTVWIDDEAFLLRGTCDEGGGPLSDIDIDSGSAWCDGCEGRHEFDTGPILEQVLVAEPEASE